MDHCRDELQGRVPTSHITCAIRPSIPDRLILEFKVVNEGNIIGPDTIPERNDVG
jgi:hypothetical protein